MSRIYLHPEKGVNPRLTICQWCGGPAPELVLVGINDSVYVCGAMGCDMKLYGGMGKSKQKCPKCGQVGDWRFDHKLEEYEKLPGGPCEKCEKLIKEQNERMAVCEEEVRAGGIFWKCDKCGSEGAIKRDHPMCVAIRKEHNKPAPELLGIKMPPDQCPICSKEGEKAENVQI